MLVNCPRLLIYSGVLRHGCVDSLIWQEQETAILDRFINICLASCLTFMSWIKIKATRLYTVYVTVCQLIWFGDDHFRFPDLPHAVFNLVSALRLSDSVLCQACMNVHKQGVHYEHTSRYGVMVWLCKEFTVHSIGCSVSHSAAVRPWPEGWQHALPWSRSHLHVTLASIASPVVQTIALPRLLQPCQNN